MDWYSWLSKAKLEPTTIYNYSILFADNELEEEDIAHFDHDFLQSMGVSIAKHRLEILKLSKKHSRRRRLLFVPPITKILVGAFSKSKQRVARYFNTVVVGRDRSAIVAVAPSKKKGGPTDQGMVRRKNNNRRVVVVKQARLLITNGHGGGGGGGGKKNVDTSSMVGYGGGGGEEEVRWDCMFHDMKPT